MVCLCALDLILRNVRARMMGIALVIEVACMTRMIVPLTRPASEFQLTRSWILKFFDMVVPMPPKNPKGAVPALNI
jgi:hypothetical protein